MAADIPVALLETAVFLNVVQVVPPDHDGALHLGLLDDSGEDASTHRAVASERALLVDVGAGDGLDGWGGATKTWVINRGFCAIEKG